MSSQTRIEHGGGNLGYLLRRVQHAFRLRLDKALAQLGVTTPQYAVLSSLSIEPGISNAALARAAMVTAQTMLGIVENLEKRGLLSREPDAGHGRVLAASLTERGKAVAQKAHRIARLVEDEMVGGVSLAEVERTRRMLEKFAENLADAVNG